MCLLCCDLHFENLLLEIELLTQLKSLKTV